MVSFKKVFSFIPPEIASAFQHARAKKYTHGLKLLESPLMLPEGCPIPDHGKLLIVTPRACGKAHERNRIKRQARAIFYEEKLYQKPMMWILLVRKGATDLTFDQLKKFLCTGMKE